MPILRSFLTDSNSFRRSQPRHILSILVPKFRRCASDHWDRKGVVRIASMTKPITSTAVMILVDEGKVRLDDPLSKFTPVSK
ncbi:serine hydrolase [Tundrisphaera lichenicola]|uniref:serine hydrolase n=1 Tax=Tundrisphaera lichenicola TaxID=2029860 RepID=UPI003EBFF21E